jgi:predicted nucleic acid-binding protein
MDARRFLDTNILIYAYDLDAPEKRSVALKILEDGCSQHGEVAVSVQVLQELHANLCRRGISQMEAAQVIRDYSRWPVVENTVDLLIAAQDEQSRWKLSFWDALILAAARVSGASELITEDLNHGQKYDGLRDINTFR